MPDTAAQASRATTFTNLHVAGQPVILYNAWDGGSARAIADSGARAIATGDHPVGYAHGYTDDNFDAFPFNMYLATVREIAAVIGNLPLSVDISNGAGLDTDGLAERIRQVIDAGGIGVNFEDRAEDEGIIPAADHANRIQTVRATAESAGVPLHINARTDLFATADEARHAELIDEAVERAITYKQAGADSFFVPLLKDIDVIRDICDRSPLPVNIIRLPGTPSTKQLAAAGVARISYGPVPQMAMIEWLKHQAEHALDGDE